MPGREWLIQNHSEGFGSWHRPAPGSQRRSLGFLFIELQRIKGNGQVAQGDQVACSFAAGFQACAPLAVLAVFNVDTCGTSHAAGVFAEGDVTYTMHAVFNRSPVADNEIEQLRVAALFDDMAGGVVGDLGLGCLLLARFCQIDGDPFDGNEAPAATEPALLRTQFDGLDAAAHQFAVAFLPLDLTLWRGKKPD